MRWEMGCSWDGMGLEHTLIIGPKSTSGQVEFACAQSTCVNKKVVCGPEIPFRKCSPRIPFSLTYYLFY